MALDIPYFLEYFEICGLKKVSFLGNRLWKHGHGLQTPNEVFFRWNPKHLGLGRQFGQIKFWAFGVLLVILSAPILALWVPCPCFPLINHYFYKKTKLLYPNIYLGLGFEFGSQQISSILDTWHSIFTQTSKDWNIPKVKRVKGVVKPLIFSLWLAFSSHSS